MLGAVSAGAQSMTALQLRIVRDVGGIRHRANASLQGSLELHHTQRTEHVGNKSFWSCVSLRTHFDVLVWKVSNEAVKPVTMLQWHHHRLSHLHQDIATCHVPLCPN